MEASVAGLEASEHLRGESARFFEGPGHGSHVAQLFSGPISYRDADGPWKPIDNSLVETEGGLTNAANEFGVFFPDVLATASPVKVTYPEGTLSFSPVGARPAGMTSSETSVSYEGVLPETDIAFDVTARGVKERAVLASPRASRRLRYRIEVDGLALALRSDRSIDITDEQGRRVGYIPAPFAFDDSLAQDRPPENTDDVSVDLRVQGPGFYLLDFEISADWFEAPERRFPVTLDPEVVRTRCDGYPQPCQEDDGAPLLKDTFIQDQVTTVHKDKPYLLAGNSSTESRTFMTFDVRQEIRKVGDLVYEAKFDIYNDMSGSSSPIELLLKRITQDWDENTTWDTLRPSVDANTVWAQHNGCSVGGNCKDGWNTWDVKKLMQYWIDTHAPSNHGWEISVKNAPPNAWKYFLSNETSDAFKRPHVNVWVNAMPGTKDFAMDDPDWPKLQLPNDALPTGITIQTDSPKFTIRDLTDANKDVIMVRYQVSSSATAFESNIVYDSGWLNETHSHRVPSGYLSNGKYYWRVVAGDVCPAAYADPDPIDAAGVNICDDLSSDSTRVGGATDERPTSDIRWFTVKSKIPQVGKDPRWSMWSKGLGNEMDISVNEATGNLVWEYPIDSLGTAAAPLDLKLTYNSQTARQIAANKEPAAPGMAPGWELAAGPAVDADRTPTRIEKLSFLTPAGNVTYGVEVTYGSGKRSVFAESGGGLFTQAGPLAATIRQLRNQQGWSMTTASGGTFLFSPSGGLVAARPSSSRPGTPGFEYGIGADRRLNWLKDPLGRQVDFTYGSPPGVTAPVLTGITVFGNDADPAKKIAWTIGYESGMLTSILDPEEAKVKAAYDTQGRLHRIFDGEQSTQTNGSFTSIVYSTAELGPDRPVASKITLPVVDAVPTPLTAPYTLAPATASWEFLYSFPNQSSDFSTTTKVYDPRGASTSDAEDYMTRVDFNRIGLPIYETGPRIAGPFGGWPETKKVWNFDTKNLQCRRGPAANAIASLDCGASDGLQTQYEYQTRAPHLLTRITQAAGTPGGSRMVTTFGYDEGFAGGLQTHLFENTDLTGLPKAIDITPNVSADWGEGGPAQLGGDSDFSARYFGEWVPGHATGLKDYEFRLTGEDEARLIVGDAVVLDCIATFAGQQQCNGTSVNTATVKGVAPASHRIVVELRAVTGPARVKLEWRRPDGQFEVVPQSALRPALDVLTSEKIGTSLSGETAAFSTTSYEYTTSDHKLRSLPSSVTVGGGSRTYGSVESTTTYTYDDHGRVLTEVDATGQPITHDYQTNGPCELSTTDRVGLVVARECNSLGEVEKETATVGGILTPGQNGQSEQTRVTTTTYTKLGRVDRITNADGGYIDYDYDAAGRVEVQTVLEDAGVTQTTDFVRNARGWIKKELLPDPDGDGPLPRPEVGYKYDSAGNTVVTTDELNNEWIEEHDAANHRTLRRDPVGNEWRWNYGVGAQIRKATDPHGVSARFTYDANGRVSTRALGDLTPETIIHDERGSVVARTDPDGITTSFKHNAFGKVTKTTIDDRHRIFEYDESGFLSRQSDFRGNFTAYGYDAMGHLKSVTLPPHPANQVTHHLNEAGEIEKIVFAGQADDPGFAQYDYDEMGRIVREIDASGRVHLADYDKLGQVVESFGSPYTTRFTYDRLGRETRRSVYTTGSSNTLELQAEIRYEYDPTGNLTSATDEHGEIKAGYDDAGRLESVGAEGKTTTFAYENARLKNRTDAAGTTSFAYQPGTGRIDSISGPFPGTVTTYDYKPSGRLRREDESTGRTTTYDYDASGRLKVKEVKNSEGEVVARFESGYNADSQVTSRSRLVTDGTLDGPDNGTWTYTYDEIGRLRTATDPAQTEFRYDYDLQGNRTLVEEERNDAGVNRVTSTVTDYQGSLPVLSTTTVEVDDVAAESPLQTTYQHDSRGNLERIDGPAQWRSFTYDAWGQLRTASKGLPGEVAPTKHVYDYDALGRTLEKATVDTVTGTAALRELFWYAGLDHELVQTSLRGPNGIDADTVVSSYAYRGSEPYAIRRSVGVADPLTGALSEETTSFLGTDPHGDVVYTMDHDEQLRGSQSYDPWGEVRAQTGEKTHLGFQSDHTDSDLGLVDMGARFYLPELGRFISQDPLIGEPSNPLTLNRYLYGLADPVTNTDPTGLRVDCEGKCPNTAAFTLEAGQGGNGSTKSYVPTVEDKEAIWSHQMDLYYSWVGGRTAPSWCTAMPPTLEERVDLFNRCIGMTSMYNEDLTLESFKQWDLMGPCWGRPESYECRQKGRESLRVLVFMVEWFGVGKVAKVGVWAFRKGAGLVARGARSLLGGRRTVQTVPGPIKLRSGAGAAHMDEFAEAFARKVKLPVNSPAVLHRHLTVDEFIARFRKASIRREIPTEFLSEPVEEALVSGNRKVRKLLTESRWSK